MEDGTLEARWSSLKPPAEHEVEEWGCVLSQMLVHSVLTTYSYNLQLPNWFNSRTQCFYATRCGAGGSGKSPSAHKTQLFQTHEGKCITVKVPGQQFLEPFQK